VTAEEMVRFVARPAHPPDRNTRGRPLRGLDLTVRPEPELADKPFAELPATASVISAVIRDGDVMFPHRSDVLRAGDRVIVLVEGRRHP
jgi:Trk K+ transport system NAD-binding subunit